MGVQKMNSIQISLDIPDVEVLQIERDNLGDYIITVESTKTSTLCRKCSHEATKVHSHGEPVLLRHLPIPILRTSIFNKHII